MEIEKRIAEFISETNFDDLPNEPVEVTKNVILTIVGTTIAGASREGCEEVINQVKDWGGKEEATLLIYGGKVPAHSAVLANSTMARALDICDAYYPGIHIGASSVPTALAAAELAGGCSGQEFLAAIVLGTEVAARINAVSVYDGFDPTGVCTIFATAAIAGRLLHLNSEQMLNALALAFNRSGGSFQSNIDGSLAVRLIQGFVSQGGMISAQLARRGITGPKNFIDGIYGYFHLFAKDKRNPGALIDELGDSFAMTRTIFKSYPSCGATISSTDAMLDLLREVSIKAEDVERIDIRVEPHTYKLTGHPFEIGDNPRVNAQFSIPYCVANALLRKSSKLHHFEESYVKDPKIVELAKRVHILSDPGMEAPDQPGFRPGAEMKVTTKEGNIYLKTVSAPSGFPDNPLTGDEIMERFRDNAGYAERPFAKENLERIVALINRLDDMEDVRTLIPLLVSQE